MHGQQNIKIKLTQPRVKLKAFYSTFLLHLNTWSDA